MAINNDAFYDMIDSLISRKISSAKVDQTVEAKITDCTNVANGEYRVEYEGNEFSAFSLSPTATYNRGELVYVLVPGGNFSARKVILGLTAFMEEVPEVDLQILSNYYVEEGPNWADADNYGMSLEKLKICACPEGEREKLNKVGPDGKLPIPINPSDPVAYWEYQGFIRKSPIEARNALEAVLNTIEIRQVAIGKVGVANEKQLKEIKYYDWLLWSKFYKDFDTGEMFCQNFEIEKARALNRLLSPTDTFYGVVRPEKELAVIDERMQQYSTQYKFIKISADFQTLFQSSHSTGEYALKVTFLIKNPKYVKKGDPTWELHQDEHEFLELETQLGFKDFIGEPYRYPEITPQKAYFEVPQGAIAGISKISLVQDGGMDVDYIPVITEDGELKYLPDKANYFSNNIQVTNIDIHFCRKINLLDSPTHCWIEEPNGNSLFRSDSEKGEASKYPFGRETIKLVPHFINKSQELTKYCKIMWFREDLTIPSLNPKSPNEDDRDEKTGRDWTFYTGPGWRPIEHFIDDPLQAKENEDYFLSDNGDLIVNISGVPWQWRFRCVCIYDPERSVEEEPDFKDLEEKPYNKMIWGDAITTVYRADSKYNLAIKKTTDDISSKTNLKIEDLNSLTDAVNKVEWVATWYYQLVDDGFHRGSDPYHYGPWDISQYAIADHITFRAMVYDPVEVCPPNGEYNPDRISNPPPVGIVEYVTGFDNNMDLLIDWQGQKTFNFTAAGQPYNKDSLTGCKIEPRIKWISDGITPFRMAFYGPDGMLLNAGTTVPDIAPDSSQSDKEERENRCRIGLSPDCSMLENIWVDHNNIVHFNVRKEYDKDRTKNTLRVVVNTIIEGQTYDSECEILITKDGQNGTQGTAWSAPLRQTNGVPYMQEYNRATLAHARYSLSSPYQACPLVLEPINQSATEFKQVLPPQGQRVYIRPFVTKDGKAIESLIESGGENRDYRYIVHWDVRMPQNTRNPKAAGASFLRICDPESHAPLDMAAVKRDLMGKQNPPVGTPNSAGLQAMTAWSGDPNDELMDIFGSKKSNHYTYGAVEIQYVTRGGLGDLTHEDVNYQFVVKATIDIETRLPTDTTKGEETEEGMKYHSSPSVGAWHRIKTIVSWYPVDLFIYDTTNLNPPGQLDSRLRFDSSLATMNWPREILYDSLGYNPIINGEYLEFLYGADEGIDPMEKATFVVPDAKLCPTIQNVRKETTEIDDNLEELIKKDKYGDDLKQEIRDLYAKADNLAPLISKEKENKYRLEPKGHLNWQEGSVGVLKGYVWFADPENKDRQLAGWYYRNQIYTLNAYGNIDINTWDGQGIEIDEDNGTIFAPTIGAGYKSPYTNKFTGILMGVNSGFKKNSGGKCQFNTVTDTELENYPYMTGLFGYQEGVSAFALLENGTAYFGRKDRGGRIVIDGYNATIYGGGNGVFETPQIGDPMWNNMRLNLVDLAHSGDHPNVQGISNGFGMKEYFGGQNVYRNDEFGVSKELPPWYQYIWRNAFFCSKGTIPWWVDWQKQQNPELYHWNLETDGKIVPVGSPECERGALTVGESLGPFLRFPKDSIVYDPISKEEVRMPAADTPAFGSNNIYFVDYWSKDSLASIGKYAHVDPSSGKATNLSTFGPSRASTTPAIEIGQHPPGLMPGLLPWGSAKHVFRQMWIPGDRNFMVTYDGTLWAMNGVFMGNVIGSNIIGGRMQGVEMGIGEIPDQTALSGIRVPDGVDGKGNWEKLYAPLVRKLTQEEMQKIKGNWHVDSTGSAVAKDIKIFGGQIDLGSFHITGPGTVEGNDSDAAVGNLIQYGISDFVGPTHFYGNVGIGLALNAEGMPCHDKIHDQGADGQKGSETADLPNHGYIKNSNAGNLFQTNGLAALGIVLRNPTKTTELSTNIAHGEFATNKNGEMVTPGDYLCDEDLDGNPQIGTGTFCVQRGAMFAVDSLLTGEDHDKYQGHFWPMSFKYNPSDNSGLPAAYLTTMNLFKTTNFPFGSDGVRYEGETACTNYVRIGSYGLESQLLWFRKKWQDENKSSSPSPIAADGQYIGWIGYQNRNAGADKDASPALGFSTAYHCPILFYGDGEYGTNNRGHVHILCCYHGAAAKDKNNTFMHEAADETPDNKEKSALKSGPFSASKAPGVAFNLGTVLTDANEDLIAAKDQASGIINKIVGNTACGPVSFAVLGKSGQFENSDTALGLISDKNASTALMYMGMIPSVYGKENDAGKPGIVISSIDPKGWIHLRSSKSSTLVHTWDEDKDIEIGQSGKDYEDTSEIVIKPSAVNIAPGKAFRMQLNSDPHLGLTRCPNGMAWDDAQMVLLHENVYQFGSHVNWISQESPLPEKGGFWGTGKGGWEDWQINYGYPKSPSISNPSYFQGTTKIMGFYGEWAKPDNQFHIYARFG